MKIVKIGFLLVLGILLFARCEPPCDIKPNQTVEGTWHIRNISGGIAGIDEDHPSGEITWTFDNQTLTVQNNAPQGSTYTGFPSGTYDYSVSEIGGTYYLTIDNVEFGSYSFQSNSLIINQNELPSGSGADGFVLQLEH